MVKNTRALVSSSISFTRSDTCTARIGPEGEGVVDGELRVHGVEGLRVADASVLPVITRANTNAPAIMVGERCASFIRGYANAKRSTCTAAKTFDCICSTRPIDSSVK